eukprot:gene18037-21531_t
MQPTPKKYLLFDQFLLVSLKEDTNGAGGIVPYVKNVYPPDTVDPNVPLFCFPEEIDRSYTSQTYTPSKSSESFSFVLTDREGNQQFGFTRRIVTPSDGASSSKVPESLCIISHHAWFSTFTAILEILEIRYRVSIEDIHNFLAAALLSAIPAPGEPFSVYIYNNPFLQTPSKPASTLPVSYVLRRPLATDKSSLHDGTLLPLIESLTSQKILSLFISLLFERRIMIYSENIGKVSKFVNAAVSLLEPFIWQHIFIPILPRSLLDYCTAPMPFIIGVHSSLFPLIRKKPLNEIIFVDLDKDQVLPLPEDIALFPPSLVQQLKTCLDTQILDWKKNKHYDNKVIVDTFRKFFVSILGTYRRFFLKDMDKKKMIFDKASFIDSQLITPTKFFNIFCSSQMFERFIAEREEYYFKGITPPGIFEKEVVLYDLKNPVTASINNTLKSKEKEKERERERERLEKERVKAMAKAHAYRQVLDVKKTGVINPKSNGSSHTVTAADISGSLSNVILPKPKSQNNLASLASGIIHTASASITKSTSTSFTMGHSTSAAASTPLSSPLVTHQSSPSLNVLVNGRQPETSSPALGKKSSSSIPTSPTINAEVIQHINSARRKEITIKSIPFVLIHQKFSPQDTSRLDIEDLYNFLFPPQVPVIVTKSATPPSASPPPTHLFKIPEVPEHFAIPLSIHRPRTTSHMAFQGTATSLAPMAAAPSSSSVTTISPSYSVSDKSTLPPPPASPHSLIRSHHRSSSVSTSTPSSKHLTSSLDPHLISSAAIKTVQEAPEPQPKPQPSPPQQQPKIVILSNASYISTLVL